MLKRSIALIGMPGSGKTTLGKRLARVFGAEFVDVDALTEKNEGMSIPRIFELYGEEGFRERETRALRKATESVSVISCGGGIVTKEENRAILRERTCAVYVCASVETLAERVGDGKSRPLLAGDAKNKLKELMSARARLYESASALTVCTDGLSVDEAVEKAEKAIKEYTVKNGGKF